MRPLPVAPIGAEYAGFYAELVDFLRDLAVPKGPQRLWACASDALPPAIAHPNTCALASDLGVIVVSNGTAWIRQDTGAAL